MKFNIVSSGIRDNSFLVEYADDGTAIVPEAIRHSENQWRWDNQPEGNVSILSEGLEQAYRVFIGKDERLKIAAKACANMYDNPELATDENLRKVIYTLYQIIHD